MPLDPEICEFVVCPKCKKSLVHVLVPEEKLVCDRCSVYYRVTEEIPILLIEEACPL